MYGVYIWKEENGTQTGVLKCETKNNAVVFQYMTWFKMTFNNDGIHHIRVITDGKTTYKK